MTAPQMREAHVGDCQRSICAHTLQALRMETVVQSPAVSRRADIKVVNLGLSTTPASAFHDLRP